MAYLTEMANWIGNILEELVNFLINIHAGMFLLLAVLFITGFIVYLFMKLKDVTKGVNS